MAFVQGEKSSVPILAFSGVLFCFVLYFLRLFAKEGEIIQKSFFLKGPVCEKESQIHNCSCTQTCLSCLFALRNTENCLGFWLSPWNYTSQVGHVRRVILTVIGLRPLLFSNDWSRTLNLVEEYLFGKFLFKIWSCAFMTFLTGNEIQVYFDFYSYSFVRLGQL